MTLNLLFFIVFICVESLLLLSGIIYIYSFIPIHWSGLIPKGLEPERESLLFIIFLIVLVGTMLASVHWLWRYWESVTERVKWHKRLLVDGIILTLIVILFSKWVTYAHPFYPLLLANDSGVWVKPLMGIVLAIAVCIKVSWYVAIPKLSLNIRHIPAWQWLCMGITVLGVLIFPHPHTLEPLSFMIDGFQHIDQWPFTRILLLAGYDYTQVMMTMVVLMWIVTGLAGYLVYRWVSNIWLALGAMILFVKIGFFNYAQTPAAWINPGATPLAGFLDIIAYISWYVYVRKGCRKYLVMAIAVSIMAIWVNVIGHPWTQAPIYQALRMRQFWSFFMTFALAIFFTGTACFSGIQYIQSRQREWIMPCVIAIGGLFGFWAVIQAPAPGAYAWCALSLSLLVVWYLSHVRRHANTVAFIFMVLSAAGLLTNHIFLAAPHMNVGMYQTVVNQYQGINWQSTVNTINQYNSNEQSVAIISPYEIAISHAAQRHLFFHDAMIKKIEQIQQDGPCVIFIDRNWVMNPEVRNQQPALAVLLESISRHYVPVAQQPQGALTVWMNNRESCLIL